MSQKTTPIVHTAGLCKVFRDFWRRPKVSAVKDLNVEIRPGQIFGLLGPNGSGKSTTIKMLLGLLYPSRGRIAVFGKAPTDVAVKNRIGFLPEESYLYRFLDARETLDYYGRLFRLPERVRTNRIEKLLDMVGLRHESKRRIGEYSKGMARRIGLAQALINDPDFLILDEPTSGLDPMGTRQIKDVIRELGRMGKTILLSSHVLADVEDVCDEISILYGGQQRAAGDIKELLSKSELTQITTEKLSEETIEQIRDLLTRLEKKDIVSVGAPRHRLEDFFIQVVQESHKANIATSGVRAVGGLPDFLGETAHSLVESLVDAGRRPAPDAPAPEPVEPVQVVERPERPVVEELLASARDANKPKDDETKPSEPRRESSPKPREPRRAPADADRAVIDGLIKGGGAKDGGP